MADDEHERSAASGAMYVYLNSGAVDAVPSVECLAVDERTVTLNCTGEPRRYSRSAVYMISRELISPPMQF